MKNSTVFTKSLHTGLFNAKKLGECGNPATGIRSWIICTPLSITYGCGNRYVTEASDAYIRHVRSLMHSYGSIGQLHCGPAKSQRVYVCAGSNIAESLTCRYIGDIDPSDHRLHRTESTLKTKCGQLKSHYGTCGTCFEASGQGDHESFSLLYNYEIVQKVLIKIYEIEPHNAYTCHRNNHCK